ncbi:hypothetical protein GF340_05580, partial [Candidatus Peregrinibacteria bacterium]|nr:hypothetical protein [Candidatus Peregrinibacteria bacterium]
VLREVWAVTYLALAVLIYLSLGGNFGVPGELLVGFLKPILGWGIQVLPFAFLGASLMLFLSKKIAFPLSRILGIFLLGVSLLSILHLYVPMESLFSEAQAGNYGGYVGFVTNFLMQEVLGVGQIGAVAVFLAMLLIGILLTFEISLVALISFLKPNIKIVRQPTAKKSESKKKEVKVVKPEDIEDDEDDDVSEEKFENERFKALSDESASMVTIKRPITPKKVPSEENVIQIREEDKPNPEQVLRSEAGDYKWEPPPMDILHPAVEDIASDDGVLQENAKTIRDKLKQFGINVDMHEVHVGPTVIQYTLRPNEGIKLSKITGLKSDLALALAAKAVRIEAPIPGKSLVGIEVPNDHRTAVHLRELLESKEFAEIESNLKVPLGRDVSGKAVCADLANMPHVLIAGATGAGKSVGMNSFLAAMLYQNSPADLKLIMVDPKRVELTVYNNIPHLLTPVITDPEKAAVALRWTVAEMNRRLQMLSEKGYRNITEYNLAASKAKEDDDLQKMPNIVVVIDELADLMMAAGKEVEASICRIAQMARAVGIHLMIATQRPSVDVITGLIKANIPTRIAFAVSSAIDSRTIIDGSGAEDLLGKGDMLYLPRGMGKPMRIQGIFISTKEIERITNYLKTLAPPNYLEEITSTKTAGQKLTGVPDSAALEGDDHMYEEALKVVIETRKASASLLQRRLKIGYARAARLLDIMEENGVIGPVNGAKAREIFVE